MLKFWSPKMQNSTTSIMKKCPIQFLAEVNFLTNSFIIVVEPGDADYCTSSNKCGKGIGGCHNDSDCQTGLVCGTNNCEGDNYTTESDCCSEIGEEK